MYNLWRWSRVGLDTRPGDEPGDLRGLQVPAMRQRKGVQGKLMKKIELVLRLFLLLVILPGLA